QLGRRRRLLQGTRERAAGRPREHHRDSGIRTLSLRNNIAPPRACDAPNGGRRVPRSGVGYWPVGRQRRDRSTRNESGRGAGATMRLIKLLLRSEERRVGKECTSRRAAGEDRERG